MSHRPARALLAVTVAVTIVALPPRARAQIVTPKTVPVHQDDQFQIHPSQRAGMGGASIAIDDTLLDPFVNPAKGARLRQGQVFVAPFSHRISDERGGGRSLPIGAYAPMGRWTLAGVVALQQLDRAGPARWNAEISDQTATNQYGALSLARDLGDGLAIGAGAQWAALGAVDGVDLLYANSSRIEQDGSSLDLRVGLTKAWRDRTFELVALHDRYQMTHDVEFRTWTWDPILRQGIQRQWSEHNADKTRIWGVHSEFTRPVGTMGWRLGVLGTVNRLSHPKIPNYSLMNIPRDPGTTYAGNLGVGLARERAGTTVALDAVYEPITSETWADAGRDTARADGGTIRVGERTVTNRFRFGNGRARLGIAHEFRVARNGDSRLALQGGLALHSISYRLRQSNHVTGVYRTQDESWVEWGPRAGVQLRLRGADVLYSYARTCATGPCERRDDMVVLAAADVARTGGIIVAPAQALTFQSGRATRHQLAVVVPVR